MKNRFIEDLLPAFFEGSLSSKEKGQVVSWKNESDKNTQIFNDSLKAWERIQQLQTMQKYNASEALVKVNQKIQKTKTVRLFSVLQKIAAVLILPLIITTVYLATNFQPQKVAKSEWHTIKTPPGIRSEFVLPDGTKVILNSKTTLIYPVAFNGVTRNVKLNGEAYFDVAENKKQPFIVNTGKINIEVTGTEFKASNYANEDLTEIVLVEGNVRLFQGDYFGQKEIIKAMVPGEKASFIASENKLYYENVEVEKYISWKNGILMFRDDSMQEIVRRLNRWYNVEIQLTGKDLGDYVYTATFQDESLYQILELLKLSAPIDYKIKNRHKNTDQTFSKMEIEIIQK